MIGETETYTGNDQAVFGRHVAGPYGLFGDMQEEDGAIRAYRLPSNKLMKYIIDRDYWGRSAIGLPAVPTAGALLERLRRLDLLAMQPLLDLMGFVRNLTETRKMIAYVWTFGNENLSHMRIPTQVLTPESLHMNLNAWFVLRSRAQLSPEAKDLLFHILWDMAVIP